jgi:hypothetical protein
MNAFKSTKAPIDPRCEDGKGKGGSKGTKAPSIEKGGSKGTKAPFASKSASKGTKAPSAIKGGSKGSKAPSIGKGKGSSKNPKAPSAGNGKGSSRGESVGTAFINDVAEYADITFASESNESSRSTGATVGIVFVGLVIAAMCVAVNYVCCCCWKKQTTDEQGVAVTSSMKDRRFLVKKIIPQKGGCLEDCIPRQQESIDGYGQ